ncbi:MAG: phosphoethanolamine transferase [Selenomonadaceae bacterium]|nr:phosphoethanolamine transferase [Selenomonadaceae bacterium]
MVPMILILTLAQFGTGEIIFSRQNFSNLLTGLAWCATFILVYTWTYQQPWFMSLICYDFVVGTAIFLFLSSLENLCAKIFTIKFTAALICALTFLFWLIPFVQAVYYCMFWHCLSPASLMALYLTNWRESIDFIRANIGDIPAIIILLTIGFLLRKIYKSHEKILINLREKFFTKLQISATIITFIAATSTLIYFVPQTSIAGLWKVVTDYVAETEKYSVGHSERFATLEIDSSKTLAAKAKGTVIFIIGESASRTYMQAFNPNFPFDNTPWLSSKLTEKISAKNPMDILVKVDEDFKSTPENTPNLSQVDGEFIIFQNAYASWSQTVPVLQRALTEQSQYNDKEFYKSVSIVDVAKKAGYKTFWFSNQGRYGEFDSAVTLVAKTADVAEWTDDAYDFSHKYDESLLNFLTTLNPDENNFVVLHLMGSHIYYNSRYPRNFKKWTTADGTGMMLAAPAYANTILYTDFILSKIFDYAAQNLNLQALIYFSDHGEDLQISHNPDVFSFDMVRVPMFVYLSPDYEKNFPAQVETLNLHREKYFTNDMIFDTVCGILNAPSNHYDAGQDFSSTKYKFNRDNLTTMLGQHKISEDDF